LGQRGTIGSDRYQHRGRSAVTGDDCRVAFLGLFEKHGQPIARFFRTLRSVMSILDTASCGEKIGGLGGGRELFDFPVNSRISALTGKLSRFRRPSFPGYDADIPGSTCVGN
jgi:hypothetical protein